MGTSEARKVAGVHAGVLNFLQTYLTIITHIYVRHTRLQVLYIIYN